MHGEEEPGRWEPEDFYSIDLMNAYACLGRILGEEVGEDLVNEIFSNSVWENKKDAHPRMGVFLKFRNRRNSWFRRRIRP